MGTVLIFVVGLILYFIPALVGNGKKDSTAIWILNLFLGWTFIGWVAALVWACTSDSPRTVVRHTQQQESVKKDDKLEQLAKLKTLLDTGALTPVEFETEKAKILRRAI